MSSPVPGFNWNDPYAVFNEVSSQQLAQMTPEQRAQFAGTHIDSSYSPEQWKAWDKDFDPTCPSRLPYRGRAGQCAEKPDDCPPGTTMHGNDCVSVNDPAIQKLWGGAGEAQPAAQVAPQAAQTGGVDQLAEMLRQAGVRIPAGPGGIMGGQNVTNPGSVVASRPTMQTDALTSAMTPIQGQRAFSGVSLGAAMPAAMPAAYDPLRPRKQTSVLGNLLTPLQGQQKRQPTGSWF